MDDRYRYNRWVIAGRLSFGTDSFQSLKLSSSICLTHHGEITSPHGLVISLFIGDLTMQQITSYIPRTEQAIFNLIRSINELCALQHELSVQDMIQIDQELEILRSTLQRKRALAQWVFPCVV